MAFQAILGDEAIPVAGRGPTSGRRRADYSQNRDKPKRSPIHLKRGALEHLKKFCSRLQTLAKSGLFEFWLRFGSVAGRCGHAPSPKPRQNSKILAANGHRISLNALMGEIPMEQNPNKNQL
jgi:hypothetical protein